MGIPSMKWRQIQRLPGTHFMSTSHSGTNSDGRHSLHSCSLPVNTSWVLEVAFDFCSDFLWQQPHTSNELSIHCLSGLLRLSCAALYANPHNKRLELGDKCEPYMLWISLFFCSIFFCLSDHSWLLILCNNIFSEKPLEFPKYLLFHCVEKCLVHTHAILHTIYQTQRSSEVTLYASHSTLAHSSKLGLYMLDHCDKYPAYLWGLSTWGVNGRLERNRLTCAYNNRAEGIVVNHWGPVA